MRKIALLLATATCIVSLSGCSVTVNNAPAASSSAAPSKAEATAAVLKNIQYSQYALANYARANEEKLPGKVDVDTLAAYGYKADPSVTVETYAVVDKYSPEVYCLIETAAWVSYVVTSNTKPVEGGKCPADASKW